MCAQVLHNGYIEATALTQLFDAFFAALHSPFINSQTDKMKLEHNATLTVELKKAKDKHSIEIAKVRQELSDLKTLTIPYLSRSQSNMNKAAGLGRRGSLLSSVGGGSRRGSMMSVAKSRRASIIGTMSVREEDSQTGRFRRQRRESEIIEEHAISGDVKLYSETGKAKDEAGLPNLWLTKKSELW